MKNLEIQKNSSLKKDDWYTYTVYDGYDYID